MHHKFEKDVSTDLAQIEVDEVLGLVRNVRAEVAADNAVPGHAVLLVELLLDERSDILQHHVAVGS